MNELSVLADADMFARMKATREQPVVAPLTAELEPSRESVPGGLRDLERRRSPCFLLDGRNPLAERAAWRHIADPELHQIAPS